MDIIKAFKLNEKNYNINIQGTLEEPLFQASQIGKFLEIKNIRTSINKFDSTCKINIITQSSSGEQNTTFLTFKGLNKLLCQSKKLIAETFKNWIYSVIREIRTTGGYVSKEDNKVDIELKKGREQNKLELLIIRNNTLIEKMKNKRVVYLSQIRDYNEEGKRIIILEFVI